MRRFGLTLAVLLLAVSMVGWQPAVAKTVRPAVIDLMVAPHMVRPVLVAPAAVRAMAPETGGTSIVGMERRKTCRFFRDPEDLAAFLGFGGDPSSLSRQDARDALDVVHGLINDIEGQRGDLRKDRLISDDCRERGLMILKKDIEFLELLARELDDRINDLPEIPNIFENFGDGDPPPDTDTDLIREGVLNDIPGGFLDTFRGRF